MAYNPHYSWSGDSSSGLNFGYKFFDLLELVVQEACMCSIRGDVSKWYRTLRAWYRLISPWIKDTKKANNRSKVEMLFKMAHRFINDPANNAQVSNNGGNQQQVMMLGAKSMNVQKTYLILDQLEMIMLDIMKSKNLLLPERGADDEDDDDWDLSSIDDDDLKDIEEEEKRVLEETKTRNARS